MTGELNVWFMFTVDIWTGQTNIVQWPLKRLQTHVVRYCTRHCRPCTVNCNLMQKQLFNQAVQYYVQAYASYRLTGLLRYVQTAWNQRETITACENEHDTGPSRGSSSKRNKKHFFEFVFSRFNAHASLKDFSWLKLYPQYVILLPSWHSVAKFCSTSTVAWSS